MKIEQHYWTSQKGWNGENNAEIREKATMVLAFGGRFELSSPERFNELREFYPNAHILCASTSGEIFDTQVFDNSIVATAFYFEKTPLHFASASIQSASDSFEAGSYLAAEIPSDGLVHVFVISDGQNVNGSELLKGLTQGLPSSVAITGGLAGDGALFQKTLVGIDAPPAENTIVIVGFYGEDITIGYGSLGGWDSFGPERIVTRSSGNVLYELDGKSALDLYKMYLGEQAAGLPGTALLFPLSIKIMENDSPVVRTILSINEEEKSMTFAGDLPVGAKARLMKANFERLIDGASSAANASLKSIGDENKLTAAILISCVGRKLVLGQRIEEEVESVREVLGENTALLGFYSYGEISPFTHSTKCELHNQTMTITTFSER